MALPTPTTTFLILIFVFFTTTFSSTQDGQRAARFSRALHEAVHQMAEDDLSVTPVATVFPLQTFEDDLEIEGKPTVTPLLSLEPQPTLEGGFDPSPMTPVVTTDPASTLISNEDSELIGSTMEEELVSQVMASTQPEIVVTPLPSGILGPPIEPTSGIGREELPMVSATALPESSIVEPSEMYGYPEHDLTSSTEEPLLEAEESAGMELEDMPYPTQDMIVVEEDMMDVSPELTDEDQANSEDVEVAGREKKCMCACTCKERAKQDRLAEKEKAKEKKKAAAKLKAKKKKNKKEKRKKKENLKNKKKRLSKQKKKKEKAKKIAKKKKEKNKGKKKREDAGEGTSDSQNDTELGDVSAEPDVDNVSEEGTDSEGMVRDSVVEGYGIGGVDGEEMDEHIRMASMRGIGPKPLGEWNVQREGIFDVGPRLPAE